jgi:hypothetical protein
MRGRAAGGGRSALCAAALCGALAAPAAAHAAAPELVLAPPPTGTVYHAEFPDFGGPEDRVRASRIRGFERDAGARSRGIDSSRRARRAYRRGVDGSRLTSEPVFVPR